ncbi:unnamed protein product [Enterobius vermicularis]|uniref:glutathione transferase n=1 Tax=Enterobius vermicularis TaxID=51028 RepID=A0A3P6HG03_ENTVE|nr:unnamed protein product [Enterobius vermicularis]
MAEPIRLLLTDQQIPYDDHRVDNLKFFHISFNILAFKQFGQVPCLYDDNEQIVQSGAILRHLARKHGAYVSTTFCCFVRRLYLQEFELRIGLNGSTEMETTYADMFYEGIRDLHTKYCKMIYNAYMGGSYYRFLVLKETEKDSFIKEILPDELAKLEKLLISRNGGEGFVLGDKICFTDYVLFEELDIQLILTKDALEKFPSLKSFHKRMSERPHLKDYLKKRHSANVPVNGNGKQ